MKAKEDEGEKIISRVAAEAFLVKDESLLDTDAPFFDWLLDNGFQKGWHKGHWDGCDWVFINITHKLYACGMPGIKIVQPIGDHAITIEEFMQIYNIYEKYKGLEPLKFPSNND